MKNKQRFIWVYSVMLFAGAILLILISALSQSRVLPGAAGRVEGGQQAFNQTIQKSVAELTLDNEALNAEVKSAKERIAVLEAETQNSSEQNAAQAKRAFSSDLLMQSEMLFNTGKYAVSFDALVEAERENLSEQGKELYDWLKGKLQSKGYKITEEE